MRLCQVPFAVSEGLRLIVVDEEELLLPEGDEAETRPLLKHRGRIKSFQAGKGNATLTKAALLLLKSFVGTGVLFLPKAYVSFRYRFSW